MTMTGYRYRISVELLEETAPVTTAYDGVCQSLTFHATHQDEILAMVDRARGRFGFDASTAASFGVGLKLLSETVLRQHRTPALVPRHRALVLRHPALVQMVEPLRTLVEYAGSGA